ncbi:MAG: hypothetical protein ACC628_25170, partial [Pirellulaceae bacterium]
KAIRNLQAIQETGVTAPNARAVISSLWMRSVSATQDVGGTRNEVQLDVTRDSAVDPNQFTTELATIVENSFNIHEVGTHEKRFCFKLPENPEAKLKAWAKNDRSFDPEAATAPGLLPVGRDQQYLRDVLVYLLKSPESVSEQPSTPIVLDPNWESAPWANIPAQDQPAAWTERGTPVLIALPVAPNVTAEVLGPWLVEHVAVNRNMLRFLLSKVDEPNIYDDRNLLITARCALLAREWKANDSQYEKLHRKYENNLKADLKTRFDRYAILGVWDFETPTNCTFHEEKHRASGADIPTAIEKHIAKNYFAPEDFEKTVVDAATRGDTMKQLLALLRSEPLPGQEAIPYLGELAIYEEVLEVAANEKIALNVGGRWFRKEAGESKAEAAARLRQKAWCTGQAMHLVQLGELSQVGSSGLSVTPPVQPQPTSTGTGGTVTPPGTPPGPGGGNDGTVIPTVGPGTVVPPEGAGVVTPAPVIRRSLGAKSGINLLGDLEKWALPDQQKVVQAALTMNGLTVKELRDLVTRLPPKIVAELQITLPPEQEGTQ